MDHDTLNLGAKRPREYTYVVNGILKDLWGSGGLDDNVETERVLILDLLELGFWVRTGQFNVFLKLNQLKVIYIKSR
jgi:hypothetical protein